MEFPEPRHVRAEVMEVEVLSPRVHGVALRALGPDPFVWIPGQHLELALPDDERKTPYSIASAPDAARPGRLELAVARGSSAGLFDEVAAGARLDLFGPKGRFVRHAEEAAVEIYIGTGTGLAPLRAMLQQSLAEGGSTERLVLFGVRTESEILWRAELEALARDGQLRFEPTLSQAGSGWRGRTGRVQDHLNELVAPLSDARIYVCGVSDMVVECVSELIGPLGFPRERVLTETH